MYAFEAAAQFFLRQNAQRLPDLSGITILVPNRHVIPPFLAALTRHIELPAFLPPRLLTLPALAAASITEAQPDSLRLVQIHAQLRQAEWIEEAARWPLALSLHGLLREMDESLLHPPQDLRDFKAQVEIASRRLLPKPMEAEARLVFEVWRAFHLGPPGTIAAHALALATWLERAEAPLHTLGLRGMSRLEECFLAACRDRIGLIDLPVPVRYPLRFELMRTALLEDTEGPALRARAGAFAATHPGSPVQGSLQLHAAADLEAEAGFVASRIHAWLAEGRRNIGIIALDRLAARRLRAILERDAILVQDESGWTFSTAAVSHVIDRWLALLRDDFYHRDLLDLLKSPYVFADLDNGARLAAIATLEAQIRKKGVVEGLDHFLALGHADETGPSALPLLQRIEAAAHLFGTPRRRTLSAWLATLRAALDILGASSAFAADNAGRQLLELLDRLGNELATDQELHTLSDWHRWLNVQLDSATFAESDIESPIRLTHLNAARLRDFEALVVLGADAAHLPPHDRGDLLNDALRLQLGLQGQARKRAELCHALIEVLARADRVVLSWQQRVGSEPNPASPWLDLLDAFHRLAYGTGLRVVAETVAPDLDRREAVAGPAPSPSLHRLPDQLSASAWQRLVSCPYRYFAVDGLGLGEAEEVAEEMEKADYGEIVHAVLKTFHDTHPRLAGHPREELIAVLTQLSQERFAAREGQYFLATAWRLRWEKRIPAYVDWAQAWEASGHTLVATEQDFARSQTIDERLTLTLRGRIDRLDTGADGASVLDYKAQSRERLRAKAKAPSEDVQLGFYGLLTGASEAAFVCLDDTRVEAMGPAQPLADAAAAEAARLQATWSYLAGGAGLPAQGAATTCRWCEMRGLCRRDFWA